MADHEEGGITSTTTTKSPGGGPIIQQSQESEEYQRALQTVVGTALGVILLVGLLALFFLLYRLRRQRHRARFANGSQQHSPVLQRSISLDVGTKPVPSVLVLYAYDCAVHEAVVVALSGLLMEACGITVSLDVFEENVILERGLEDWLEDRLQEADFIVVVCSLGARLRCSKKRVRFREEAGRLMPDYFAVAVDYVAEKLRVERSKGLGVGKFVTIVMDYSRLSDIPPQLEAATSFTLMRDFHSLCVHLTAASPHLPHKTSELAEGAAEGEGEAWQQTEVGVELWAVLGQARTYFKTHPNWLEDRLEPLSPRSRAKPRRRRRHDREAHDTPLLPLMTADLSSHSTTDMNTSANVVIHMQNLPQRSGAYFAHSRQNSLPSSLCSSHPPAPTSVHQSVSRSVDNFPPSQPAGRDFGDGSTCLLCQQQGEGWGRGGGRRVRCPLHPQGSGTVALSDTDGDSELELGMEAGTEQLCSRSKSLPSVGCPLATSAPHLAPLPTSHTTVEGFTNTALSHSRTILHAEVHKEWDAGKEGDAGKRSLPDAKDNKHGQMEPQSHSEAVREWQLQGVPEAPKMWDLSKVPEAPKEWNSVMRPCGRVSPASVSSDSSCSSYSAGQSGSDSLERDLRSITMPRIFDHTTDSSYFSRLYGVAPPRSLSSSALLSVTDGCLRPVPFLTPVLPASHVEFTFDFSPLPCEGGGEVIELVANSQDSHPAATAISVTKKESQTSPHTESKDDDS